MSQTEAPTQGGVKKPDALQQHVAFFDPDNDDVVWPRDTYNGFRKLGFNFLIAISAALGIHFALTWLTWDTWIPDPFLRMRPSKMPHAIHGSDTKSYLKDGAFDNERFERTWNYITDPPHEKMTLFQVIKLILYDIELSRIFVLPASIAEWGFTWLMLRGPDGTISKADVKGMFDDSTFNKVAIEKGEKKQK